MMRRFFKLAVGVGLAGFSFGLPQVKAEESLNFGAPYVLTGNFDQPYGLGLSGTRLFVADTGHRRFKWMSVNQATAAYSFQSAGYVSHASNSNALVEPQGIAADPNGNVYVVNTRQGHVKLYQRTSPNSYTLQTAFASSSSHTVEGVPITLPRDIAVGPDNAVYLLDSGNNRILKATGPSATRWTVFYRGNDWQNPYGLDVDDTGKVFVADTGNHRVIKISGGTSTSFGGWGEGTGRFRFPRDVAVDKHGRLFVADTSNHRLVVLDGDGRFLRNLGYAPSVGSLQKVEVDNQDRVFALDSDSQHVLAFLGAGVPAAFDPYFRDHLGDPGDEPSNTSYPVSSPDILVRHQPDVNLASAAILGLENWAFQQPRYGENNYVYVALHNRGKQTAADNFAQVFWFDFNGGRLYPEDWHDSGFYDSYIDSTHNVRNNILHFPAVTSSGTFVQGPLLWRPPNPDVAVGPHGELQIGVRVNNPYDQAPVTGDSRNFPRNYNNVTRRTVVVNEGPFTTGVQNTLAIRVHFPDKNTVTNEALVNQRLEQMAAWVSSVSWNQASVSFIQRGPITLPETSSYYYSSETNPLVEMVETALDKVLDSEPNLLDGNEAGAAVGRIILITNDTTTERDWATTGHWPYTIKGEERNLSASIQGIANPLEMYAHGISHQLNLVDLYAHENHVFPKPYADGWDNMAKPYNGAHPFLWNKEKAEWPTYAGKRILFVPRPGPGVTWDNNDQPIRLRYQVRNSTADYAGVAFGLTHGITSFNEETAFYYLEARSPTAPQVGPDSVVPDTGVIMYYANRLIPQGQGPVIIYPPQPGDPLTDAAIRPAHTVEPPGTGLNVTVHTGNQGSDYRVRVKYTPPETDYDVFMHKGDPDFLSPDIWVDNQQDGYDEDNGDDPEDRGNQGIAGEENRVYARVFNHGPAKAHDVEVAFFFSEPWHTVGEETEFDEFRAVFLDEVPGEGETTTFVEWTPATGVNPHTCALVELRRMFNDTNAENNWAQKNLEVDHSVHGSPYTPVKFTFQVANDRPTRRPIYFQLKGVPAGWQATFNPKKLILNHGERGTATVTFLPPQNAPDCTSHTIYVTGWTPDGDTMVRTGGTTVRVDLAQKTKVTATLSLKDCEKPSRGARRTHQRNCTQIVVKGCTTPPLRNQEITVRYEGPDGEPIYHEVMTDENGCYEDFLVTVEGGEWEAGVNTPAVDCRGPAYAGGTIRVPLPERNRPEAEAPNDAHRLMITAFSKNIEGETGVAKIQKRPSDCNSKALRQPLHGQITSAGPESAAAADLNGTLVMPDLLHFLTSPNAGFHRGRFRWTTKSGTVVGRVDGLTNIGTRRPPVSAQGKECAPMSDHWETTLVGTFVTGPHKGARLRANALLAPKTNPNVPSRPTSLKGTVEGAVEKDCSLTEKQITKRIERALKESKTAEDPCGEIPCLARLGLSGPGQMKLMQTGRDRCDGRKPSALRTWNDLKVLLTTDKCGAPTAAVAANKITGIFRAPRFAEAFDPENPSRAVHGASFTFKSTTGLVIQGTMVGVSASGTHRKPFVNALEKAVPDRQLEGRLTGTIVSGPQAGTQVWAHYTMQVENPEKKAGRERKLAMVIDGWMTKGCLVVTSPGTTSSTRSYVVSATTTVAAVPPKKVKLSEKKIAALLKKADKQYRPLAELPSATVAAYKKAYGGKLSKSQEMNLRLADRDFRKADVDNAGGMSAAEFSRDWSTRMASGRKPGETAATAMVKKWDKNKNGGIDKTENAKMWKKNAGLDTNRDGIISAAELTVFHRKNETDAFAAADINKDGKIDFTEYALWRRTWPKVQLTGQ